MYGKSIIKSIVICKTNIIKYILYLFYITKIYGIYYIWTPISVLKLKPLKRLWCTIKVKCISSQQFRIEIIVPEQRMQIYFYVVYALGDNTIYMEIYNCAIYVNTIVCKPKYCNNYEKSEHIRLRFLYFICS